MTFHTSILLAAAVSVFVGEVLATNHTEEVLMSVIPGTTVTEGSSVSIICETDFDFSTDTLRIRHITTSKSLLTITKSGTTCIAKLEFDNVECMATTAPLFYINITRVAIDNGGKYECEVTKPGSGGPLSAAVVLDVQLPSLDPPSCSETSFINSSDLIRNVGDNMEAICSSDISDPPVALSWTSSGSEVLNYNSSIDHTTGKVTSILNLTLDTRHDGIVLTCMRNTNALNANESTCSIGPFKIKVPTTTAASTETYSSAGPTKSHEQHGFPFGAIIAIIVVSAILVLLFLVIIICCCCSGLCCCTNSSDTDSKDIPWYENAPGVEPPVGEEPYTDPAEAKVRFVTIASDEGSKKYPKPPEYPVPEGTSNAYELSEVSGTPQGEDNESSKGIYENTQDVSSTPL